MENYYYLSASIESDLRGAHGTFEIALSSRQCSLFCLCAPFFSTQVRKYLAWVYNAVSLPGDCHASYASFLTNRLSQATIASLMLAYSFSPKLQKYLLGSPFFRSQWQKVRCTEKRKRLQATAERQPMVGFLPLETDSFAISNGRWRTKCDVNGAARHRAVLRYIAKRHKVTAKINTLHNARKRKRFSNANLWLGSCPVSHKQKTHNQIGCAFLLVDVNGLV